MREIKKLGFSEYRVKELEELWTDENIKDVLD